jgi:tellurite methyltransferase
MIGFLLPCGQKYRSSSISSAALLSIFESTRRDDTEVMSREPFWEAAYRDQEADTFGEPSEELVHVVAHLPRKAIALDLGCGDGRNALYLAKEGLAVDAFDHSIAGIRKLEYRAAKRGLSVRSWVQTIETYAFSGAYDLVLAHGVLHLLEPDVWRRVLAGMQRHTVPGGWNVVVVFTDRIPAPPDLAPHVRGAFREGDLLEYYKDWIVEHWEACTLEDEHPGGIHHCHSVNRIVARKPHS